MSTSISQNLSIKATTQPKATAGGNGTQFRDPLHLVFPEHLELLPQVNEVYEIRLAYMEYLTLTEEDLLERGAYFAKVRDQITRHFLICSGNPLQVSKGSSIRLKTFFEANQFKTGYATHGLFPYRGKFHPQMIKALINILELRPGDVVLDPMMGSGTTLVEASLMGIDSIGVDISPFCVLMSRAKADALSIPSENLGEFLEYADSTFAAFEAQRSEIEISEPVPNQASFDDLAQADSGSFERVSETIISDGAVGDFIKLAYLDSLGFARRRKKSTASELFPQVLEKYIQAVEKVQTLYKRDGWSLGNVTVLEGDARDLELSEASVDGVIFSPPYSFAIDYLDNDADQLRYLGHDLDALRLNLIGLRKKGKEKVHTYFEDMRQVMADIHRVLKPDRYCAIVVGSNRKQLARILKTEEQEVKGIEDQLVEYGEEIGFELVDRISRQITGMHNIMRNEYILIFRRLPSPA